MWPFQRRQMLPARLTGPDTTDGRCFRQALAGALGGVEEEETFLRLGPDNFTRVYAIHQLPDGEVHWPSRLARLLTLHQGDPRQNTVRIRISMAMLPGAVPQGLLQQWWFDRTGALLGSSEILDAAVDKAREAYKYLRHQVDYRDEVVYRFWLLLTLVAPDQDTLARLDQKVMATCRETNMAAARLFREQVEGLHLTHALGGRQPRLLAAWPERLLDTHSASHLLPFRAGSCSDGTGVYIAHELDLETGYWRAAYADFIRSRAMNWIAVGETGSGKSTLVKAVTAGLLAEGFRVVQYDASDEYKDLCDYLGGVHIDHSPESGAYYEPMIIPGPTGDDQWDTGRFRLTCDLVHAVIRGLAPDRSEDEKAEADRVLMLTWAEAGVDPEDPATWDRPSSLLHWYERLTKEANAGSRHAATLRSRLYPYFEGSQRLFRRVQRPEWGEAPYIRISVSQRANNAAADERVAAVKTLLVNHSVWQQIVADKVRGRRYTMVHIDEGQRVLRDPDMAHHIYLLATDGRKHNAGLCVSANDVSVFFDTAGGRGLWENATLRALFGMAESGLQDAAARSHLPEPVLEQVRTLSDYQYMLSRDGRYWSRCRLFLPEEELQLMQTRGLRQEGA